MILSLSNKARLGRLAALEARDKARVSGAGAITTLRRLHSVDSTPPEGTGGPIRALRYRTLLHSSVPLRLD